MRFGRAFDLFRRGSRRKAVRKQLTEVLTDALNKYDDTLIQDVRAGHHEARTLPRFDKGRIMSRDKVDYDVSKLMQGMFGSSPKPPSFKAPPAFKAAPLDVQQAVLDDVLKARRVGQIPLEPGTNVDDAVTKLMSSMASLRTDRIDDSIKKLPKFRSR